MGAKQSFRRCDSVDVRHRMLRNAKIRAWLNLRLEDAWKPLQMGGEQALGRVALLASDSEDERIKLAALRTSVARWKTRPPA